MMLPHHVIVAPHMSVVVQSVDGHIHRGSSGDLLAGDGDGLRQLSADAGDRSVQPHSLFNTLA